MEKNYLAVDQILEDLGVDTKTSQKQQIVDFAMSYAQKLIKKCIEMKSGLSVTNKIQISDVRDTYELMHSIKSPQLSDKQEEQRKAIIDKTKKTMLDNNLPSLVNTVNIIINDKFEHLMMHKQLQLTFQ